LLGALVCRSDSNWERLKRVRGLTGPIAGPDAAWLLLRGLKTLDVRVRRQSATALELAGRLAAHPAVERVRYPGLGDEWAARFMDGGFGGLLSFDAADTRAVETSTRAIKNATSLGGTESTMESRHRWEGDRVPQGLLRLSVGLEDVEELWSDLDQSLGRARYSGRVPE
jgi:cystathionine gamma-synthase